MGGSHVVGSALVDSPGGGVWSHGAHETLLANQHAEEAAPAPRGLITSSAGILLLWSAPGPTPGGAGSRAPGVRCE
eukprot:3258601-Pyramimonas_sp.AAC.1